LATPGIADFIQKIQVEYNFQPIVQLLTNWYLARLACQYIILRTIQCNCTRW